MDTPIKSTTPPIGNPPTAFSRSDSGRVAEATRYVERQYRNSAPQAGRGPRDSGTTGAWYRLTATLSAAGSLSTITNATATPQKFSGTTISDDTGTVTVYNLHNKSFASSNIVWAAPGTGGKLWVIDARDCPT